MTEKQEKKPQNFWLCGETPLVDLPEIGRALRLLVRRHPEMKAAYHKNGLLPWKAQPEGFEGLLRVILAQQISTAAATHLVLRLQGLLPEVTPRRFLKLDASALQGIGLSRQKIAYGRALAESIVQRKFNPSDLSGMDDAGALEALTALRGIGPWSAEIHLMFSLGRGDIWPAGDIGLQKGLQRLLGLKEKPDAASARELGRKWEPCRTAAALVLWQT